MSLNTKQPYDMFKAVSDMNTAFGNPKGFPMNINREKLVKQLNNIPDEFEEIQDGMELWQACQLKMQELRAVPEEDRNAAWDNEHALCTADFDRAIDMVRDGMCDVLVFTLGGFHFMGIDAGEDMRSVVDALYSRFCTNSDQLVRTSAHYAAKGVEFYIEGDFPRVCLKSAKDQPDPKGTGTLPKGKFLKCVDYKETQFKPLSSFLPSEAPSPRQFFKAK